MLAAPLAKRQSRAECLSPNKAAGVIDNPVVPASAFGNYHYGPRPTTRQPVGARSRLASPAPLQHASYPRVVQCVFDREAFTQAAREQRYELAVKLLKKATPEELARAASTLALTPTIDDDWLDQTAGMVSNPRAELVFKQAALARRGMLTAQGHIKQDTLSTGIYEDLESTTETEATSQDSASIFTWDSTKRGQTNALVENQRRTRQIERALGISLRSTLPTRLRPDMPGESRTFSGEELETIYAALMQLPSDLVAENPHFQHMRRQPSHQALALRGAEYSTNERSMNIFDATFTGPYRATGEVSALAGRPGTGLSPGQEAIIHETGHSVEALNPVAADQFKALAGWQEYPNAVALITALTDAGMDPEQAQQSRVLLDAQRAIEDGRQTVNYGGFQYMIHPDNPNKFFRRQLNRMPGDDQTPEAGFSHVDYARTSAKEHFAEMFTHMVNVPERTYQDYVHAPQTRLEASQALLNQAQQQRATLMFNKYFEDMDVPEETLLAAEQQIALLDADVQERSAQQAALGGQWDTMREHVFGVSPALVDTKAQEIRAEATEQLKDADLAEQTFRLRARRAATPRQLDQLKYLVLAEIE